MKQFFYCAYFSMLLSVSAFAQTRRINLRPLAKDTVMAPLNSDYYLIEDSCAQILRYSRFDFQHKKFIGKFRDVNKDDTTKIVAEGNYSADGLKDGDFVIYYLNGKLHAKGSFKNDKYEGKWEFYNEDGSPQMTFDAADGHISIIDVWNSDHKKIVSDGSGKYRVSSFLPSYVWAGRLVNGMPNGTWSLVSESNDDAQLMTEDFDNGKFLKGGNAARTYTDSSHIVLVDPKALSFTNAEKLRFSQASCNIVKLKSNFVDAKYPKDEKTFFMLLGTVAQDYINDYFKDKSHLMGYSAFIGINGEIDEKGNLVNLALAKKGFEQGLLEELAANFPRFEPAMAYGKPVKQKIAFTFRYSNGTCSYAYKLLPLDVKQ